MAKLKKFDLKGEKIGDKELGAVFAEREAPAQLIKEYITAIRKNKRQWSANTKGRSEVSHSNKKPHRQKGTGNARQGSLASPQYKGGGVVFGPKPKFDQHVRINRKERRNAMAALLKMKSDEGCVCVVDDLQMDKPQTKQVAQFLKSTGFEGRSVLFVETLEKAEEKKQSAFSLSVRNLPKVSFLYAENLDGYSMMRSHYLVLSEAALEKLKKQWVGK